MRRCTGRRGARSAPPDLGAAAVEFALVLVPLMLILVGMIQFGRVFSLQIQLAGAANAGARYLAVQPADVAGARQRAKDAASNLGLTDSEIATTVSPSPCTDASTAKVVVTRVLVLDIPFLPNPKPTVTGTGVVPCTG